MFLNGGDGEVEHVGSLDLEVLGVQPLSHVSMSIR